MGRAIRQLRDVRSGDAPEVGGKAARLGELLAAGVRVPAGIVVGVDRGEPTDQAAAAAELRAAVRSLGAGPFAVRSSGVGEDGVERSFAGIYESVLDVAPDDLPAAVERVPGECRRPGPRYDADGGGRMAVIVQRMVAPALRVWRSPPIRSTATGERAS